MIRYIIGWFNRREGTSGYYSTTYKSKEAARKDRRRRNQQHTDRAHGIVTRTGGARWTVSG